MNIYLINIDAVNDYIAANRLDTISCISTIEFVENMSQELCMELCNKSGDMLCDLYTPKQFEAEFNNDIDNRINSDKYFIRIF